MHRTHRQARPLRALGLALAVWLAGCSSLPQPHDNDALQREAVAGTRDPVPAPLPLNTTVAPDSASVVRPQLSQGSGQFIRPTGLATPRAPAAGPEGVTFNFENQPVQAVVKAILGDLLKKNYTIVPGVQGNISFSTAEPVDAGEALPILETLLSWTGNALVLRGGSYVVLPAKDALGGNLVPSLGASAPQGGLQARLFPLRYISATEMEKLIKPFARPDSILLVDSARNLLVMSGTAQELANYQRTVRTFDVDWLRGMSVGVFSLQRASVDELMPKLDSMFGPKGDTPLAGMLRFIPIERTNALVVISTQPDYLREVGEWIARIDRGGGNEPQLFVYDVRNIKASDLARYLAQIYTNGAGTGADNGGQVGPGLSSATLGNADGDTGNSLVSGIDNGGAMTGSATQPVDSNTAPGKSYSSSDGSVRISAVDSNNQLLVRARPSQWSEIESAIQKLDSVPLQVQIETRILEVSLTGEFSFGVQWYLEGLRGATSTTDSNGNITFSPGNANNPRQIALGQGGVNFGGEPFFYSFMNSNLQVALRAMETSGNTKVLSEPSLVVMNNQQANIQVGNEIPVNQSFISPGLGNAGSGISTLGEVQYKPTGVILKVVPRVNPGGLVYLKLSQEVSAPGIKDNNGNFPIQKRLLETQVAVQSGQTVLLGGLIQQNEGTTDTGIPVLNKIPLIGRLFGTTNRHRDRSELLVLITPRVITSGNDARQVTDEYQRKFESLAPLRAK
ncbi:general secretion pathway protein D [Rhodanobacter fulvus Jip2]|uniref:General secretion pathway protein D n=1 Tax=Rhodanobacter fulvus Jip2 TaxID=1163408 RepID=I4VQA1_9GAMM|nr:type II secretion system secretin GspD [Rhodanobacter fulvus]EIL89392.1 general secretion pathway protein D [Rhodanobacter fulvus Jip2]